MSKLLTLWDDLTGVVLDYALSTPPSAGWLMCYGQVLTDGVPSTARLRTKLIADAFPHGQDGNGNPKVPDARGRATAGKDDMGGTAANRLTTAGAGIDGAVLGSVGGSQTHTLTTAQLATHAHGVTDPAHAHTLHDPGHDHSGSIMGADGQFSGSGTGKFAFTRSEQRTGMGSTGITIYGAYTGISIKDSGSGQAHNNTQPTLVLNKIIKL